MHASYIHGLRWGFLQCLSFPSIEWGVLLTLRGNQSPLQVQEDPLGIISCYWFSRTMHGVEKILVSFFLVFLMANNSMVSIHHTHVTTLVGWPESLSQRTADGVRKNGRSTGTTVQSRSDSVPSTGKHIWSASPSSRSPSSLLRCPWPWVWMVKQVFGRMRRRWKILEEDGRRGQCVTFSMWAIGLFLAGVAFYVFTEEGRTIEKERITEAFGLARLLACNASGVGEIQCIVL